MLTTKILEIFEKVEKLGLVQPINLARKKFISLVVLAMIQSRSVQFTELAAHMDTNSLDESNLRRIQDFIANYELSYAQISILLLFLLPESGTIRLAIDRTNWEHGASDINILTISAYCQGVGIPLWFEMLEDKKGGNSNTSERKRILRKVLRIIKGRPIELYGDREFVGQNCVKFLLKYEITFYIRLKSNTILRACAKINLPLKVKS